MGSMRPEEVNMYSGTLDSGEVDSIKVVNIKYDFQIFYF